MPTYDYVCSKCEHHFDKILKMDDRHSPEGEPCPNCSSEDVVKLAVTAPNLVSPFRVDGLKKTPTQFKERMSQIRHGLKNVKHNLKDDY